MQLKRFYRVLINESRRNGLVESYIFIVRVFLISNIYLHQQVK